MSFLNIDSFVNLLLIFLLKLFTLSSLGGAVHSDSGAETPASIKAWKTYTCSKIFKYINTQASLYEPHRVIGLCVASKHSERG